MAQEVFMLTPGDVLMTSLFANACLLLQLGLCRVVDKASGWLKCRTGQMARVLSNVYEKWPGLLGRILMEQVSLLAIVCIILVHVSSASIPPFSQQQLKHSPLLIRLVFTASTARLILILTHRLLGRHHSHADQSAQGVGHMTSITDQSKIGLVYVTFCIASNIIFLGSRQNLVLGLTTPFLELSSIPMVVCRLIRLGDRNARITESYRKYTLLNIGACVVTRFVLPLVLLGLALGQESPLVMDHLPLTWFFIALAFHTFIHVLVLYQAFKWMSKASSSSSFPSPSTVSSPTPPHMIADATQRSQNTDANTPFSIHYYPDLLSNDINGIGFSANKKSPDLHSDIEHFAPTATKLKDLNYGFLRCYDNRNLYSNFVCEEDEKMNFHRKKSTAKYVLLNSSVKLAQDTHGVNSSCNNNNAKTEETEMSCYGDHGTDSSNTLQGLLGLEVSTTESKDANIDAIADICDDFLRLSGNPDEQKMDSLGFQCSQNDLLASSRSERSLTNCTEAGDFSASVLGDIGNSMACHARESKPHNLSAPGGCSDFNADCPSSSSNLHVL